MRHAYDIPASIINLRLSIAVQYGANRDSILEEAGIAPNKLSEPTNRITIDETIEIWKAILNQTGSQEIGLMAGLRGRLQSLGILGYVMMNSNTIKDSYAKLCTYQRLVASMAFQKMEIKNSLIHITLEMQINWHETFRYTMDFMVASSFSFVREHTVNRITPLKMGFNFEEPDNAERYRELFQPAIVEFGHPQSFLIYRESDFNDSIVNPSNELHEQFKIMLEAAISEHDNYQKYTRQVRQHIQKGLKAEIPLLEDVAAAMAMSVRSLQQHLKEEGTSYQKLLNEVRKDVSVNQLKNKNLNISDVAFLTGFSDISIFSRNFKKWTGLTPSQFQLRYA